MDIQKYAKAIVPLVVTVIVGVIAKFGITPDMSVNDALTIIAMGIITSLGVYQTPNKK